MVTSFMAMKNLLWGELILVFLRAPVGPASISPEALVD
jgi:hypothetical protein